MRTRIVVVVMQKLGAHTHQGSTRSMLKLGTSSSYHNTTPRPRLLGFKIDVNDVHMYCSLIFMNVDERERAMPPIHYCYVFSVHLMFSVQCSMFGCGWRAGALRTNPSVDR